MYRSLHIDHLEARALPSLAPGHAVPISNPGGPIELTHPAHGHVTGSYTSGMHGVDAGVQDNFTGTGHITRLGNVTATGMIDGVGDAAQGHAMGTLTFTSAKGSLTIDVTGPVQKMFSPLPQHFHYHVISGTGVDAHVRGTGTLSLNFLILDPPAPVSPGMPATGGFVMTIH